MWPGILIVCGAVSLYMASFALNKKTAPPEGFSKIDALKCGACQNFACTIKQSLEEEEAI